MGRETSGTSFHTEINSLFTVILLKYVFDLVTKYSETGWDRNKKKNWRDLNTFFSGDYKNIKST